MTGQAHGVDGGAVGDAHEVSTPANPNTAKGNG